MAFKDEGLIFFQLAFVRILSPFLPGYCQLQEGHLL